MKKDLSTFIATVFFLAAFMGFPGLAKANTIQLPKTGQTTCYDTLGAVISCTGTGQDGDIQEGISWPSPRFINNGDGTITDQLTGLMWLKDGNCFGVKKWFDALSAINNLNHSISYGCSGYTASYSDWRLSNVNELESLKNFEEADVATWLNGQGFMNAGLGIYMLSTTSVLPDHAWRSFLFGSNEHNQKDTYFGHVWPVRGGQEGVTDSNYPANIWKTGQTITYAVGDDGGLERGVLLPSPRFTDEGECITDNLTGLMWTKNANLFGKRTWSDSMSGANSLSLCGHTDWKLPNIIELRSLVVYPQREPALSSGHPFINVQTGPGWESASYWSSTTYAAHPEDAFHLFTTFGNIMDGHRFGLNKSAIRYVWPVRAGQPANLPPIADAVITQLTNIGNQPLVGLDASGTSDPNDPVSSLNFKWSVDGTTVCDGTHVTCGIIETTFIGFGMHLVTLRVTDSHGLFDEVTKSIVLDSALLSLLGTDRAKVEFSPSPPQMELIGEIGLPIGVNHTDLSPEATAAINLAGIEILTTPPLTISFLKPVDDPEKWTFSSPSLIGISKFDIDWKGARFHFIEDSYPIELRSHILTSSETMLAFRFKPAEADGPFSLTIGGVIINIDASGVVTTAATDVSVVLEEESREVTLTLPFPLLATTDIMISGNPAVNRTIPVDSTTMTASTGRFRIRANFDGTPFPNGVATLPRMLDLTLTVGEQNYPGVTSLSEVDLIIKNNEWRKQ